MVEKAYKETAKPPEIPVAFSASLVAGWRVELQTSGL
jgi:hypothetical protein